MKPARTHACVCILLLATACAPGCKTAAPARSEATPTPAARQTPAGSPAAPHEGAPSRASTSPDALPGGSGTPRTSTASGRASGSNDSGSGAANADGGHGLGAGTAQAGDASAKGAGRDAATHAPETAPAAGSAAATPVANSGTAPSTTPEPSAPSGAAGDPARTGDAGGKPHDSQKAAGWFDNDGKDRNDIVLPTAPKELNVDLSKLDGAQLPDADERRNVVGAWVQTAGGNGPDFGYGDFAEAFVVFRTDGAVEFIRFFGPDRAVRFNRQLKYTVSQGKIRFEPGTDKARTFKAVTVPSTDGSSTIKARPPTTSLPSTVEYRATPTTVRIGDRTFQRTTLVRP